MRPLVTGGVIVVMQLAPCTSMGPPDLGPARGHAGSLQALLRTCLERGVAFVFPAENTASANSIPAAAALWTYYMSCSLI